MEHEHEHENVSLFDRMVDETIHSGMDIKDASLKMYDAFMEECGGDQNKIASYMKDLYDLVYDRACEEQNSLNDLLYDEDGHLYEFYKNVPTNHEEIITHLNEAYGNPCEFKDFIYKALTLYTMI